LTNVVSISLVRRHQVLSARIKFSRNDATGHHKLPLATLGHQQDLPIVNRYSRIPGNKIQERRWPDVPSTIWPLS
jgi:hypothetical protein